MTAAFLPLAHHSFGHWIVDVALYLGPVLVAAVLLYVWHRRDSRNRDADEGAAGSSQLGAPPRDAEDRS